MEGKNYKVSFLETLSAYNTAVTRISEIQDILEKLSEDITNVINSEDFTGTAADNIKTYASEIHLPLISAVATMLVDYQSKLLLYETNYFGIDSDYATKFNAETMAQVQEQVKQYLTDNETISSEMQTSLNSVSDIVSLPLPSKETVDFDLNWMIQKIDNLDESIVNYENLHSTDLDSLTDFIANLELFITYYQESIKPGDYKSGDCANNMYAYQLYESMQLSQEFLKNHEADINAAGEKLQQVADQMQADYDAACQARIDQGRAEIIKGLGVAFIGGVAIVASGGAATPLVAGALCMTGTCVFGYGLSNAMEGVDDVYYGMKGDLSSYAFNPLRDTIFMGNQEIYDLWGQANTIAVSILMPASSAYSEALAAGKTGFELSKAVYVAVAKEYAVNLLGDEATGLTVDFIDQHVGLNQTQQAAAEIFIGALIDPGTYESIGNFAGKFKAKPDGPSLNDIAHESLLPDNEINFTDFMSAEDAARYNAWNADCANGTHNNFPGLKDVDIEAWKFADGQIATATAMSRIDGSELLKLRSESVKVGADIPKVDTAEIGFGSAKTVSDGIVHPDQNTIANEHLKIVGRKAGYSDVVIERYIDCLESDVNYNIEKSAKYQWGDGWDELSPDDQQLLKDVVSDKAQTDKTLAKTKYNGAKTLLEFSNRFRQGEFDSEHYTLDDILNFKMDSKEGKFVAPKSYAGIRNAEYLPRADKFVSDQRIVDYVKELCPENKNITSCNNLQELADTLNKDSVKLELVTFQDASINGANILSFDGNFGNVSVSIESGGGTFCVPKSKLADYANKYSDICTYEGGEFNILDMERFGKEVLSGVPLDNKGGVYMITTEVPLNGANISMPSINNSGAYMEYFVSGGKLLSGELEITQKPLRDIISDSISSGTRDLVGTRDGINYTITCFQ